MQKNEQIIKVVREWIEKAENDLKNSAFTLKMGEDCPTDTACFHAQQCVEKYLKAFLTLKRIDFPKTHDVGELLAMISARARPELTIEEQRRLTAEATVDAYGECEKATGLFTMIEDHLALPFTTQVLGVEVTVVKVDLNDRDDVVAICKRGWGAPVAFDPGSAVAHSAAGGCGMDRGLPSLGTWWKSGVAILNRFFTRRASTAENLDLTFCRHDRASLFGVPSADISIFGVIPLCFIALSTTWRTSARHQRPLGFLVAHWHPPDRFSEMIFSIMVERWFSATSRSMSEAV